MRRRTTILSILITARGLRVAPILVMLGGLLPCSAFTLQVTGIYDENAIQSNGVNFSRTTDGDNTMSLATFSPLIGTAFNTGAGGVIDFEGGSGSINPGDAFTANYGAGMSLQITNGSSDTMALGGPWADRTAISGERGLTKSSSADFVLDFNPADRVTAVGFTLLGRTQTGTFTNHTADPIITLSDNSTFQLPSGVIRSTTAGNGVLDSFWGFGLTESQIADGLSIIRIHTNHGSPGAPFTAMDDLAFIVSPEPDVPTFQMRIFRSGVDFGFEWESQPGKIYDLLTSTDLDTPITEWPQYDDGNHLYAAIPSAGEITTLTGVQSADARRFFALREDDAPPPVPISFFADLNGGNDAADGSEGSPFQSIARARDAVRDYFATSGNTRGAKVVIRGGRYPMTSTLEFGALDSGLPGLPVVYEAAEGEEVIFCGGRTLSAANFQTVTDPVVLARLLPEVSDRVLVADLQQLGITNYGQVGPRGWVRPVISPPVELIINGIPQQLARFPNEGRIAIGTIIQEGGVARDGDTSNAPGVFGANTSRVERWVDAEDLYISGVFGAAWARDTMPVASVDPVAGTITTVGAHHYGFSQPARWGNVETHYFALNLLEEIDAPGEYYIDRANGLLYLLPPHPLEGSTIRLSSLTGTLVNFSGGASHIHLKGVTMENGRGRAVTVTGGSGVRLTGCTFRAFGGNAVSINSGTDHGVHGCHIHDCGEGGINVTGGDRPTLTPSGSFVTNTEIHRFNRWNRNYLPAIQLTGVGHRIANNHFYDGQDQAIFFTGNEHELDLNEIHRVNRDNSDMGSIYGGFDPTFAGLKIRNNFFHHLSTPHQGGPGVQAIFFDGGTLHIARVHGNVFYQAGSSGSVKFNQGGGASIGNNIAIDGPPLVQNGTTTNINYSINLMSSNNVWGFAGKIAAMNIGAEPFRSRYPYLYDSWTSGYNNGTPQWNNFATTANSGWFVNPAAMDFTLVAGAPPLSAIATNVTDRVAGHGGANVPFQAIPFSQIGLHVDSSRPQLGPLPFAKMGPADGAVIERTAANRLWWSPSHNANHYRVRIALDPGLSQIVAEWETTQPHTDVMQLADGQAYHWQVEAVIDQSRSNAGVTVAGDAPRGFTLAPVDHPMDLDE